MEKENKVTNFFKSFNLYDKIFLPIAFIAITVVSIVFKCDALSIVYSFVAIIAVFSLSKGFTFAPIMLICQYTLYSTQSFLQNVYGEFFLNMAILIPLQIATFVINIINKKKNKITSQEMKVNSIKWKEWLCIICAFGALWAGVYFALRALNTIALVPCTFSFTFAILANYLTLRGNKFQFIAFMATSICGCFIWLTPLFQGTANATDFIPIAVTFVLMFANNIYGIINWNRMYKEQKGKENFILKEKKEEI
jgi:nicotinamide riboside transporter PnuC